MPLAALALAACTIEVGPPPESDPPLVSEAAAPPPPQPTEPQAWSRGLDFDSPPTNRDELAEGLVPAEEPVRYSGQRLTYQSAFEPEKPPSAAELALQRARERAAAAGLPPPPEVVAAPVDEVESQALPPAGADRQAPAPRRESRLPPPPDFPPANQEWQATAAEPQPAAATAEQPPEAAAAPRAQEPWSARNSRLPAPPTFPPAPAPQAQPPEEESEEEGAADAVAAAADTAQAHGTDAARFAMAAWDAPTGTILVQVSAVSDGDKVAQEWDRLQARYPQVLKPLRLVVDQAQLGGRGVFYRVQAGAFTSQEGAAAACADLIGQGQACFVVVR